MRASINVLGPLLARCGEARVALPGGDNIGSRKLDMHLRGLEAMGADVEVAHGYVNARAELLHGARVVLEFPSVGATENLMSRPCSRRARPSSRTRPASPRSPTSPRSSIAWARTSSASGTSTIEIEGVEELHAADTEIMGDRIEAGTLLMACGIAGGEIELVGIRARAPRDRRS